MKTLDIAQARRLALARAGLLKPEWSGMPRRVPPADREALCSAVTRYAAALGMQPVGLPK